MLEKIEYYQNTTLLLDKSRNWLNVLRTHCLNQQCLFRVQPLSIHSLIKSLSLRCMLTAAQSLQIGALKPVIMMLHIFLDVAMQVMTANNRWWSGASHILKKFTCVNSSTSENILSWVNVRCHQIKNIRWNATFENFEMPIREESVDSQYIDHCQYLVNKTGEVRKLLSCCLWLKLFKNRKPS